MNNSFLECRKNAENNDSDAQGKLAKMYLLGEDVAKDIQQAEYWLKKSADSGNVKAQFFLGHIYFKGIDGLIADEIKGIKLLNKAAMNGSVKAQAMLGAIYMMGSKLIARDLQKAKHFLAKGVESGDKGAQYLYSVAYFSTDGEIVDSNKILCWLTENAESGNTQAQHLLGCVYINGKNGINIDAEKGIRWLTKSAENGYSLAQDTLAKGYSNNDLVAAYMWMHIVLFNDNDGINSYYNNNIGNDIESIGKRMNSRDRLLGRMHAQEWIEAYQSKKKNGSYNQDKIDANKRYIEKNGADNTASILGAVGLGVFGLSDD